MGVSERFACRVTGQNPNHPAKAAHADDTSRSGRRAAGLATSVGQGSSAARVPQRLPRRPRRGMARQPQEDPAAVARGRPASAAEAATQAAGDEHDTEPAEGGRTEPGCGPSTSGSTPPPTGDRSRSCPSWTSTPANASVAWSSAPLPEKTSSTSIPPGEPWRNGYVESFNSRIRDECLNINIFWSLAQAAS
jgi:Integrase core domain